MDCQGSLLVGEKKEDLLVDWGKSSTFSMETPTMSTSTSPSSGAMLSYPTADDTPPTTATVRTNSTSPTAVTNDSSPHGTVHATPGSYQGNNMAEQENQSGLTATQQQQQQQHSRIPRELKDYLSAPVDAFNIADTTVSDGMHHDEEGGPSLRRKRRSTSATPPPPPARKKSKPEDVSGRSYADDPTASGKKSSTSKKEQELLDQAWICVACKEAECAMDPEADEFLVCEGPCHRLYHVPCAGLAQIPSDEEVWKCHDCVHEKHVCGFCQEYGQDNTDVFKCQKDTCGMFFHESCLQMQNIPIRQQQQQQQPSSQPEGTSQSTETTFPDTDIAEEAATTEQPKVIKFTCPCHWCWTCSQEDLKQKEADNAAAAAAQEASTKVSKKNKGRRGSKSKLPTAFAAKKETRLFQCLECPTSYHLTCIPPSAKFHELALLCHEHAEKHELPALDLENSLQGSYEAEVDKKLWKSQRHDNLLAKRKRGFFFRGKQTSNNPFFPAGVVADKRTAAEQAFFTKVAEKGFPQVPSDESNEAASATTNQLIASGTVNDRVLFCLPCDFQEEIYSKPPPYRHIHSLRYYPENRPKKIPLSNDMCSCVDSCGNDCYNRLLYTECFGSNVNKGSGTNASSNQGGRGTNCRVGPNCGNRRLGQRQAVKKCMTKREQGKGWGLVTMEPVKAGQLVQEYLGDVIDEATKEERLKEWTKEHPNDPNFYIMCLSQGWYIDAREQSNLARFINHSCDPNCILLRFNVGGYMRNGIFALRDIKPDEFLSYDYHFDTRHGDKFVCRCGSANCRGTMKEKILKKDEDDTKKTKAQLWEQAKQQLEKDKQFLAELEAKQKWNSTIRAVQPGTNSQTGPQSENGKVPAQGDPQGGFGHGNGSSQKIEWVSNGVQDKDKITAVRNRVFLWRNAVAGSNFVSRCLHSVGPKQSKVKVNRAGKVGDGLTLPVDVLSVVAEKHKES